MDCQSLLVSKIEGEESENFHEISMMNTEEKQKMKDFLLKDFK
jgi:hypothetical protein